MIKKEVEAGNPVDVRVFRFGGFGPGIHGNPQAIAVEAWIPGIIRGVDEGQIRVFVYEEGEVRAYPIESPEWRISR